ncbi:amidinotransferase [Brachybacterium vulturis]|uniref:Amidinotransferase n=1 Tax=Brachybacterium vulturis TaxID=2017484 RepID=A0A291GRL0_9MICO|nr:arginine deiminase-related protein [Brachybacterium vulturis]ATG52875.1 amidinotransferase [Brachybacterium vulturis]
MTGQAPAHVVLVRPHHFRPNPLTAADNAFQHLLDAPAEEIAQRAAAEVTGLAEVLDAAGVGVTVVDDEGTATPDSVFPNNWLSTHADGTLALYPMYAVNRRTERRGDLVEHLREHFAVHRVLDYSGAEQEGRFLEGTGAMVLDHVARIAYACRSRRADPDLFRAACADLGYEPVLFDASDAAGVPVYHTNVLMSVGTEVALVGAEMIRDAGLRGQVLDSLRGSGREVVELAEDQVHGFLGNCLEVQGREGRLLVMSARAAGQLTPGQRRRIERSCRILAAPVPTIEAAGGSVRCMLAGIHLPPRQGEGATRRPGSSSHTRAPVAPAAA